MVDLLRPRADTSSDDVARSRSHTLRSRIRTVLVGALSVFVLLAGTVYVLAPAGASVRLTADEASTAQPFDSSVTPEYSLVSLRLLARPRKPKYTEIVYGKVDARGVPVSKMSLKITGAERKTRGQSAKIEIKRADRTYRAIVHLRPGKYKLTLTLTVHRRKKTVSTTRTLKDRRYYNVRAKVRPNGVVSLLPVSSY